VILGGPTLKDTQIVVFLLAGRRFALALGQVERVFRMVELAPLPSAPAIVTGVIDLHGALVPVVNARERFHLPPRAARLSDQLLVVRASGRLLALVVDGVEAVRAVPPAAIAAPDAIVPGLELVRGIVALPDLGIVFIHDLERFLSPAEATALDAAEQGAHP
jgi:purine-binding chemotaxis protein CheW